MSAAPSIVQAEVDFYARVKEALVIVFGPQKAAQIVEIGDSIPDSYERRAFFEAIMTDVRNGAESGVMKFNKLATLNEKRFQPVSVMEFVESKFYLGLKGETYPKVMEHLIEVNSGRYDEAVFTGAIGTAKTTLAVWTNAYQLYLLSAYRDPHALFGLDRSSEIVFVFQSLSQKLAKAVDFDRFKALIQRSPYFQEYFPYNKDLTSELHFPNRVQVKPVSGDQSAAIGQNVFGGLIDEVNYMQVIEKSKQSVDGQTYDQAIALYNSIARRRKSRFMRGGRLPGVLCIVSSKRYPGQFTDQKEEEAAKELKATGKTTIYIYDKRTWEVLPPDRFTGVFFNVFIGDMTRKPRILEATEKVKEHDQHLVLPVPMEYREDFEKDIMEALREIGGVSTLAHHPYFVDTEAVAAVFGQHESILSREECDFVDTHLAVYPGRFEDTDKPRFVHIDLAITGDSAGVACGYVPEFTEIGRGDAVERLPVIVYDFTLRVNPPKNGEIQFHKIRSLLYKLRANGLNVKWVTLDTFQSTDTLQILRQKGFMTGIQSMDTDTIAYDVLKTAMADGRVGAPRDPHALKELISLEKDTVKNKVDHPPKGSKDVADAMAGVAFGLTMRREIWGNFGVDLREMPETIRRVLVKTESAKQAVRAAVASEANQASSGSEE